MRLGLLSNVEFRVLVEREDGVQETAGRPNLHSKMLHRGGARKAWCLLFIGVKVVGFVAMKVG